MKKFFKLFALAGLLAFLAASCYKEDIQNLQKQIDTLKGGEIATIQTQISSINTSITELKSADDNLKNLITALQKDGEKYAQQIADLTAMDKTLEGKIADLQKYVDSGLKDAKDWTSATFATLDQLDSLCKVVAAIPAEIDAVKAQIDSAKKDITAEYTKAIESAVAKLEDSMKKWVNEQLADYYTIAQIDAKLDALGKEQAKIDSDILQKIQEQKDALDAAKIQITDAYKAAIQTAVESLEGKFDDKLTTAIADAKMSLQTQIDAINKEIYDIKTRLSDVENNITAIIKQIQSISAIPSYSDGSVRISGGVDVISFDVYPASAAQAIADAWKGASAEARASMVSLKLKEVITKGGASPAATVDTVFVKNGEFKVAVKFSDLPEHAMVSLHIASEKTDIASEYFGLNYKIDDLLCFTCTSGNVTIGLKKVNSQYTPDVAPEISLLYYTEKTGWKDLKIADGKEGTSIALATGEKVYFKARTFVDSFATNNKAYNCFTTSTSDNGKVDVSGNIMTLLDGSSPDSKLTHGSEFVYLFNKCNEIENASSLRLPAETLSEYCYNLMFCNCQSLTVAPALPATELTTSCYASMFHSCSSLTAAPDLPATSLAASCYSGMFNGCTSLAVAPALPATSLASSCYSSMFDGCTSLTAAPDLPATTLDNLCYMRMFYKCTSLTVAPALPATSLAVQCYHSMFRFCTYLTAAPALPATVLAEKCYDSMFADCTSLVKAPDLPATSLANKCYQYMFSKCHNISSVTMLATDFSATDCLTNWLFEAGTQSGVTNRIFATPEGTDWLNATESGKYKYGWTVENIL